MTAAAPCGHEHGRRDSQIIEGRKGRLTSQTKKLMKQKTRILRAFALCLTLLLLAAAFAGCRRSTASSALSVGSINTTTENSGTNLTPIANLVATTYSASYDTRAMLIAATRGYDMTAADFDDAKVEVGVEKAMTDDEKLVIAKRVLTSINDNASDANKASATDIAALNYADINSIIASLQITVDANAEGGVVDKILCAIGKGLNWITNTLCFGSYIVGICIFAILIEILMIPFAIKQQKNSIKQASLRPKEMAIRKKYQGRNDQATMQKMQQEIQEFYQRENYSPYSGCLPLLLQLPIIMALYYIVINPLHYVLGLSTNISSALSTFYTTAKAAGGLGATLSQRGGTIALLSGIRENGVEVLEGLKTFRVFTNGGEVLDKIQGVSASIPNFNVGKINLGLNPSFSNLQNGAWVLLFIPILTFAAYFLSAKLNRKFMPQPITNDTNNRQAACSNTMTDITMPAMSTVFTFMVPGVVGVYWIFRSLLALLKSFIMSKIMPLPTFTKEDYEKAEKEMKGKKVVVKSENAGKVRSLHHIDDEDYEDTREAALARKAALEAEEAAKESAPEANAPVEAAPLKDESDKAPKDTKKKKQ